MRCNSCGFENRLGAVYCEGCRRALTRPCQSCGEPVLAGAETCPACGAVADSASSAYPDPPREPPRVDPRAFNSDVHDPPVFGSPNQPHRVDLPRTDGGAMPHGQPKRRGDAEFTGVVRDFQAQREQWSNGVSEEIWHFRLARHDTSGNALQPVPVEMRGLSFAGSVSNGDEVRLSGRWRDGTLRADELMNLTTHARVHNKTYRGQLMAARVILILIALGIAIAIVSLVISGLSNP